MKRQVRRFPVAFALWLVAAAIGASVALAAASPQAAAVPKMPSVDLIEVDGAINPASADYVGDAVAHAATDGASALVIRLDTPGGLLTSTQKIAESLLNSPVPVIVYVAPSGASAASAGTIVTEAANLAAMAPGTTIGAAHPVEEGGGDVKGAMGKKIENFTATFASNVARNRGRNAAWVEQAVRQSAAIGEREALSKHVIDIVATDLRDLLVQASGREVTVAGGKKITLHLANAVVVRRPMKFGESVLNLLADPNIMYILMMAGMLGLYFEFAHPGVFLPGVLGAICLLLALTSFEVIPINVSALLLIVFGVALLIAEAFVTSYGVLGIGGVAAFVLGSLLLVDSSETNLAINRELIFGAAAGVAAIIIGVGYIVIRERRGRVKTGAEGLVGEIGEVREAIAPGAPGWVFVHGEIWRASSDERIAAGARARITAVNGLEIHVSGERPSQPGAAD